MNKRHFIKKAISGMLAIALVLSMIIAVPAEAKTIKVLTVTGTTEYRKNSSDKWYKSDESKTKYNKKGQETEYQYKGFNENGSASYSWRYTYSYDKKGRTKVSKSYSNGKFESQSKYTYKGKKTTIKRYDANKKYLGKTVSTSSKNKYTSKSYDAKNKLTGRYEYTWSKNKSTGKNFDAKGKLTSKWVTNYKKGKTTKSVDTSYDNGKVIGKSTSTYTYSKGWTTETRVYKSDSYSYKNVSKYKTDKAGTSIYSWRKEYDSSGKLTANYTYKNTKYTKGAAKGCVKQQIASLDGKEYEKTTYTVKQFKRKVN